MTEGEKLKPKEGKGRRFFELGYHSFRHMAISEQANQGVVKEVRMNLSGHKSAVHERYTHHELEALRKQIEKMPTFAKVESEPEKSQSSRAASADGTKDSISKLPDAGAFSATLILLNLRKVVTRSRLCKRVHSDVAGQSFEGVHGCSKVFEAEVKNLVVKPGQRQGTPPSGGDKDPISSKRFDQYTGWRIVVAQGLLP